MEIHERRILSVLAFLLLAASNLFAQTPPSGHYDGTIATPAGLQIEIDIDGSNASITIPVQHIRHFALTNVTVSATDFIADMPNIPGNPHFAGKVSEGGKKIAGDFTQGGAHLTFSLERATAGEVLGGFDGFVNGAVKSWMVPGTAIAVVSRGKVVYAKGFGARDAKNELPVTPDTLFAIGSCTKAFTTLVLGQLVDEGKLDWDKPVSRYIPGFRMYDDVSSKELTPRDLVTHRSGLPRHDALWYNNQELTRKQIVERLQYLPPSAELRERFQYNNLMFLTAGYLIEQLTGKTWEEAVRERVFVPLGMTRSNFADADSQKTTDYAKPYREDNNIVAEIPFREVGNMGPAGSIDSSVNDMAKWMLVHLGDSDKKIISAPTLRELHTPQFVISALPDESEFGPQSYAMGWFVDTYRGHLRVQHGGAIDGFSALVTLFPNDDTGIVVLTNKEGAAAFNNVVTLHAADRLLKLEPKDWNADRLAKRASSKEVNKEAKAKKNVVRKSGTKPAHTLDEYAGEYENAGYGFIHVAKDGDHLKMTYNGITAPLEHWHYEVFNALKAEDPTLEDTKLIFNTDVNGDVASLSVAIEPQVSEMTFAKKPDAKMTDPATLAKLAGAYQLGPQTISVTVRGDHLVLIVPGQPPYELRPMLGGWYGLKGLTGYRARFTNDTLELSQPNGLFTAKRKP